MVTTRPRSRGFGPFIYVLILHCCYLLKVTALDPCNSKDTIITTPADLISTGIENCTELTGNLAIATSWESIFFNNLVRVRGNVYITSRLQGSKPPKDAKVQWYSSINALWFDVLEYINGDLEITGLNNLTAVPLNCPVYANKLVNVLGKAVFHNNYIENINMRLGAANSFEIYDTPAEDPIDHFPNSVDNLWPVNPIELEVYVNNLLCTGERDFDLRYTEINKKLFLQGSKETPRDTLNRKPAEFLEYAGVRLSELLWVPEIDIRNVTNVEMPKLVNVNTSMAFDILKINTLDLPKLTNVGNGTNGSLVVSNSQILAQMNMPELVTVHGLLQITENQALANITNLGKLRSVFGNVLFSGPIWNVELPSLETVEGDFFLNSTAGLNCTVWNEWRLATNIVKGEYRCIGATGSRYLPAGYTIESERAAAKNRIPMIVGASVGAAAAILSISIGVFLYRRPRKLPDLLPGIANPELEDTEARVYEVEGGKTEIKAEAVGHIPPNELHGDFEPVEMFVSDMIPAELYGSEPEPVRGPSPAHTHRERWMPLMRSRPDVPPAQWNAALGMRRGNSNSSGTAIVGESDSRPSSDDMSWTSGETHI
ncbi:hypothetical protein H072_7155 [Dactylellina haptotyla CBS 200.50]|uniref:Receptor L-domain domain-containing protein n=1 Tax=Dactylellina haptotyla (strain CBS 200.50) TaxID=1284197 RepID=S8BUS2_DACHA|nr:hypothetical protein H072_7155 [Dactylellina haptotyla CBS 200.50]